jgi:RNA polymerase subunit RPABC4/transcription elongation factor Spt4
MTAHYSCFTCRNVSVLVSTAEKKCPLCGSSNGEVLSKERFEEGLKSGAVFNIDPRTGKRAKKRK